MTVKIYVFALCALLISIAAAAPAIDKDKFKEKCKELGSASQMEAFKTINTSRFREGDYVKIQCEVKPPMSLDEHTLYIGEQRLETKSEGPNTISATHYVTAEDRRKNLRCGATTTPTRPEDQEVPTLDITYTVINQANSLKGH